MSDWRERITSAPGKAPAIKGRGVEVEDVLELLRDGCSVEHILGQFSGITHEDVRACFDYLIDLLERERFREEMRQRIAEDEQFPERAIPHEKVAEELLAGLPDDDE